MQTNNTLYELALKNAQLLSLDEHYAQDKQKLLKNGYTISLIKIDDVLPDTPTKTAFVENDEIPTTALNLISYCVALGIYPVVYQGENEGKLIRHVVPKQGSENQISLYGSNETFFPHVDNPDLRLRSENQFNNISTYIPDTLTLLCLRKHEGVATSILLLKDVLADFSEEEIRLLQDPVFNINRPASFADQSTNKNLPLIMKADDGDYISRFDYHNVSTESEKHFTLLKKFQVSSIDKSKWISLFLEPGQAVTFDNQKVLHTRNGFKARFDGKDRWLLRVFGTYEKPSSEQLVSPVCNHHLRTF